MVVFLICKIGIILKQYPLKEVISLKVGDLDIDEFTVTLPMISTSMQQNVIVTLGGEVLP